MAAPSPYALLDQVIGHSTQIDRLKRMIDADSVPHALLFSGPSGTGKRYTARAFAAALLAAKRTKTDGEQPNVSECLHLVEKGSHPDLHLVRKEEEKKELPVDVIRKVCSHLTLKPYYSACSIALIDEAHLMSSAAGNALLMTLEEPVERSILLLVSSASHRLPETILSRCQTLHFAGLKEAELKRLLKQLLPKDMQTAEKLKKLASIAEGSLEPLEFDRFIDEITLEVRDESRFTDHVKEILSKTGLLEKRLRELRQASTVSSAAALASELAADRDEMEFLFRAITVSLRNRMKTALSGDRSSWADLLVGAIKARERIRQRSTNPQLELTSLMIDLWEVERTSETSL